MYGRTLTGKCEDVALTRWVACIHVSGLLVRLRPLALMVSADRFLIDDALGPYAPRASLRSTTPR